MPPEQKQLILNSQFDSLFLGVQMPYTLWMGLKGDGPTNGNQDQLNGSAIYEEWIDSVKTGSDTPMMEGRDCLLGCPVLFPAPPKSCPICWEPGIHWLSLLSYAFV